MLKRVGNGRHPCITTTVVLNHSPIYLYFTCSLVVGLLALSIYLFLLCFLNCLLNPFVCFPVFFCCFRFIPLLLQISPLITEVDNIFGDPLIFSATFLPKYLTGGISHCCIVGGNHGIAVHVLISQSMSGANFPHIVA